MKKYIKKIIVGVLGITLFLVAQSVLADSIYRRSVSWNTESNDCSSISIINATTNEGYSNPCWAKTSISAGAGDTINVRIYYHNTGTITANNTRLVLIPSTSLDSNGTTKSFTGRIVSDEGSVSFGPVKANLSSSQSLTFKSVKWYTGNTREVLTPLLYGQNGEEILEDSGLQIGSINAGWDTQGGVVIAFKVSSVVTEPQICKDTTATNYGGPLPCTYPPQLCRDTEASNYLGSLPCIYPQKKYRVTVNTTGTGDGSVSYNPAGTLGAGCGTSCVDFREYNQGTIVTLVASAYSGSTFTGWSGACSGTSTCTLTMNANKNVTATFTKNTQPQLCQDQSATNYLGSLPCVYPQLCRDITASNYLGSLPCVYPPKICKDTNATNYGGLLPCKYPSNLCKDTSALNYGGALPCKYYQNTNYCTITNFDVDDSSIEEGDAAILSWQTTDCTSVYIYGVGNVSTSGTRRVYPSYTTTYTINASGKNGSDSDSVKVYVDENNNNNNNGDECRITNFDADDTSIEDGDSVRLEWDTDGCDYVSISGISSNLNPNSTYRVYPSSTRTYTLKAYGDNGSDSDSIKIYVDEEDDSDNNDDYCKIDSFTASDTSIKRGDSSVLKWRTTDCDDVSISNIGNVSDDGSETIYPNNSTSYTLRAYGNGNGTRTKTITVYVDSYNNPIVYVNKNVVTTVATNVTRNDAQINGYITNSNYYNSSVYFEYGTTVNLGSRTIARNTNGNSNFSDYLTGLTPNTIYFFQAVSDGSDGIARGSIEVFRTLADSVTRPIIIQGQTVIGKQSPVMLDITNKYKTIGTGDLVDYVVTYKNIGSTRLKNPLVQVVLPANVTLVNASRGTYSVDTNTLSATIEDLEKGEEGVIYLQAEVESVPENNAQIVTTAILVYTNSNNAQENAMAYAINTPKDNQEGSLLGASAFWSGFISLGLIGWLIIILIILILILLAHSYYRDRHTKVIINNQEH